MISIVTVIKKQNIFHLPTCNPFASTRYTCLLFFLFYLQQIYLFHHSWFMELFTVSHLTDSWQRELKQLHPRTSGKKEKANIVSIPSGLSAHILQPALLLTRQTENNCEMTIFQQRSKGFLRMHFKDPSAPTH